MHIIARYLGLSIKKNFAYRANGPLVILDELMDCAALWLFWASLMELDLTLSGWTDQSLGAFMGFSLISSAVSTLFVGAWDIQSRADNGSLDSYLVKPCNPVLLILLERANFLRFLVTFPIGVGMAVWHTPWKHAGALALGIGLCILSTVLLELVVLALYELAFWLKKVDSFVTVFQSALSIRRYPLIFFGKKLALFFTYVLPVAFVATIPTELVVAEYPAWSLLAIIGPTAGISTLVWLSLCPR